MLINFKNSLIKQNELFKLKTNKSLIGNRDEKFLKKIKNLISLNELNTKILKYLKKSKKFNNINNWRRSQRIWLRTFI